MALETEVVTIGRRGTVSHMMLGTAHLLCKIAALQTELLGDTTDVATTL